MGLALVVEFAKHGGTIGLDIHEGKVAPCTAGTDPSCELSDSDMLGYHPQVILAGRRINDGMAKFIAEQTIKRMIASDIAIKGAKVNVRG